MENENSKMTRRKALQIVGGATIATAMPLNVVYGMDGTIASSEIIPVRENFFAYRSFWPEFEAMKQFREAGVNTVCIFAANTNNSLGLPYSKYPPIWRWFDKYDFESLNKQYDDVLNVNPDAEFICMIDLNSPDWLQRQLSGRGDSAESDSFTMLSCASANPDWKEATTKYLVTVIKHIEERYGDRVKSYLLACGTTDEWMDYSQGVAGRNKIHEWKKWLKDNNKEVLRVPELESIDSATFENFIRDPAKEQNVIDYANFNGELIVDTILSFVGAARKIIPNKRQIGMFFGYILELTRNRHVWCGHLEYERLYSSPEIDFFISPGTYADRPMGGGSGFMVPNGTRLQHGKGFLHEIDHRTHTYNDNLDEYVSIGWMVPWKNQAETTAGLKREFSLATVNNTSLWCFDMWGEVFNTPETMKIVKQGKKIWDNYTSKSYKNIAEVAMIVDPQSSLYLNDRNDKVGQIYQGMRNNLNRMGAPFEVFSFNDLNKVNLEQYKLLLFPGIFEITPAKMGVLNKFVFNNNRSVLFIYAPGICDSRNLDIRRVKEISGTSFNTSGISKVERDNWLSFYSPDYETVTPKALKQIALEAGVTIYCDDEVPVYANERLVAIHTAHGGEKIITLPVSVDKVKELYTGRIILVKKRKFKYNFLTPDTVLFEILSG